MCLGRTFQTFTLLPNLSGKLLPILLPILLCALFFAYQKTSLAHTHTSDGKKKVKDKGARKVDPGDPLLCLPVSLYGGNKSERNTPWILVLPWVRCAGDSYYRICWPRLFFAAQANGKKSFMLTGKRRHHIFYSKKKTTAQPTPDDVIFLPLDRYFAGPLSPLCHVRFPWWASRSK